MRKYYIKHPYKDGSLMMGDTDDVMHSVRSMALMQHYSKEAGVVTPMLDVTKELRIAASFAIPSEHIPSRRPPKGARTDSPHQRAVRVLLVPKPGPVEPTRDGFWKNANHGGQWLIQRLGNTDMLLVELQTLLPASALRPQNQSGYLLFREGDIRNFHELREMVCNGKDMTTVMARAEAMIGEGGAVEWDACDYSIADFVIPDGISHDEFFCDTHFPGLLYDQLYPTPDPIKDIIEGLPGKDETDDDQVVE
jgi:hypothetical protein